MIQRNAYAPGTFCWADLGVPDQEAGKAFYGKLFGWNVVDVPMGPGGTYTMFQVDGKDVCAISEADPHRGAAPRWQLYFAVDDVDAAVKRVEALRGRVLQAPLDVFDSGRMAVIEDPSGAVVALWQARKHVGSGAMFAPGQLCWFELTTTDLETAREFYATLFGHASKVQMPGPTPYVILVSDKREIAGMTSPPEKAAAASATSQWSLYFAVADCDRAAQQAERLGGRVCVPPSDIPGVGRFAVISDPQGATFSIIKLAPPSAAR